MLKYLKSIYKKYDFDYLRSHPLLWFYSAYLTIKFIDEWQNFPAIIIRGPIKVRINKAKNAKFIIQTKLIFESWLNGSSETILNLSNNAKVLVDGEFIIGQGIKVLVGNSATLHLKGKEKESGSGITANSIVMVNKYLEVGRDCIIAWDTFLTDCDWHSIEGKKHTIETIIGDHVWIGVGAKVLKGAKIGRDSIITSDTIVIQGSYPERSLISGNPGIVKKNNVGDWYRDMLDFS